MKCLFLLRYGTLNIFTHLLRLSCKRSTLSIWFDRTQHINVTQRSCNLSKLDLRNAIDCNVRWRRIEIESEYEEQCSHGNGWQWWIYASISLQSLQIEIANKFGERTLNLSSMVWIEISTIGFIKCRFLNFYFEKSKTYATPNLLVSYKNWFFNCTIEKFRDEKNK